MLTKATMQEIQNLKLQGLTQAEIAAYYVKHGKKPPSRPTIAKYYAMDVIPEKPGEKLSKDKAFDKEPFRTAILRILENNENADCRMSSVYDVLEEIFIENGTYESLPGNEQTLRNYIHYLEETGQINRDPDQKRIYRHVFDTPPGDQMLIDFGEYTLGKNNAIHFICLLLRYSRFLCVYAQDHKYNAEEACAAIYTAFCRLGGRIRKLVIDQDAVFVASETYGEVIKTRVFEDFCTEQELKLHAGNGYVIFSVGTASADGRDPHYLDFPGPASGRADGRERAIETLWHVSIYRTAAREGDPGSGEDGPQSFAEEQENEVRF